MTKDPYHQSLIYLPEFKQGYADRQSNTHIGQAQLMNRPDAYEAGWNAADAELTGKEPTEQP